MAEKKVVVELSVIRIGDVILRGGGGEWKVMAAYSVSDEANTVRRSGNLEFVTDGKQTVEELYAAMVGMIEAHEGLE